MPAAAAALVCTGRTQCERCTFEFLLELQSRVHNLGCCSAGGSCRRRCRGRLQVGAHVPVTAPHRRCPEPLLLVSQSGHSCRNSFICLCQPSAVPGSQLCQETCIRTLASKRVDRPASVRLAAWRTAWVRSFRRPRARCSRRRAPRCGSTRWWACSGWCRCTTTTSTASWPTRWYAITFHSNHLALSLSGSC